jgi:RND family efflux transporter MFP subunit
MIFFRTSQLALFSLIITILSLPAITNAKPATDLIFTAESATHRNTLTGFTRARASMQLTSQVTDRLIEVKADIGDRIGKDGVFARLDTTFAKLELAKLIIEQEKLTSKTSYLEKEVLRFQTLFQKQSASAAKLDALTQDLAQARLALRSLKNEERRLQEHLQRHTITAPSGWLVSKRYAEPGEWVVTGTPLAEIGDYQNLLVPLAVGHAEYLWIKARAATLNLHLPEENLTVKARLHSVAPGFDPQTRKINLELEIISELPEQRGGIRAELTTDLPDQAGALLVPAQAVSNRYDSYWLTRVNGEKVPVIVLGRGPAPETLRVSAHAVKPGDKFLRSPKNLAPDQE